MSLFFSTGVYAASRSSSKPGMVLLAPTSIAHSGTSASIGTNGQVTFTAVTSLSLNGVFSATYDNYVLSIRSLASADTNVNILCRLRASGSDASGSNYVHQYIEATSTSVSAARATSQSSARIGQTSTTQRSGSTAHFYGPFLAQPTAFRSVTVGGLDSAYIQDQASTHSLSTSYDGFTILLSGSNNITGAVQVYGVRS